MRRRSGTLLRTVLGLYLFLVLAIPLITLVLVAFTGQPVNPLSALLSGHPEVLADLFRQISWEPISTVFKTARYREAFYASLMLSAVVALMATVLGTLVAFACSVPKVPGRRLWSALTPLPLAIPPFLGAIGLTLMAGRGGILAHLLPSVGIPWTGNAVYSYGGVIFVQVVTLFPYVTLNVMAALGRLDIALGEAAYTLGAMPNMVLPTVTLPLLGPALGAGFLLVFMRSFGDFGTPLLLLPPSQKLLILEAYKDMTGGLFWAEAAIQSLVIILVVVTAMALERRLLAGREYHNVGHRSGAGGGPGSAPPGIWQAGGSSWGKRLLGTITGISFAGPLLLVLSMLLLALTASWGDRGFPDALTLRNLLQVTVTSPRPLLVTALVVVVTIPSALAIGSVGAYMLRRMPSRLNGLLDFGLNLPLVLPGIALGIGLIAAFNAPPLALHPSAFLLVLAYVLTRTPYGVTNVEASLRQIPASLEEASSALGARPFFTNRHVLGPLLKPAFASAAVFMYFSVAHDISLTLLLAPGAFTPASISLYHELDSGRLFLAAAYGVVLFIATVVPYLYQVLRSQRAETEV